MSLVSSDMNQTMPEKNMTVKSDKPKVAELKNGKIIFRQKPVTLDNHSETMQGSKIVTFRGLIEASRVPLNNIPDQHLPLIAKLVHESDKTLSALTKSLQSSLVPPILAASQESELAHASTCLPASSIEHAIKSVADRMNYGIVVDGDKVPAALCVWRWEVKNPDWLPKSVADKAAARLKERMAAKEHLQSVFDDLSTEDKETILKTIKQPKIPKGKDAVVENYSAERQSPHSSIPEHQGEDSESGRRKVGRPKKAVDPESIAKEKEKQEKKAVKAEKEKKAVEATKRSAAAFANFFKPPANSSKPPNNYNSTSTQAASSSTTPKNLNEFQATFKPFVLKKDSQLAPVNWFVDQRKRDLKERPAIAGKNNLSYIIELDADGREVTTRGSQSASIAVGSQDDNVSTLGPKEVLHSFLASETPSFSPAPLHGRSLKPPSKSHPVFCVRDVMNQLVEAEVQGDQRAVHRLNGLLKNRRKLPIKVFIFAENNRPGYLGTWTRYSPTIGPRTPFARDILSLDYDHDSDAEWEEEEGGEDVESHDESMEDDASSVGSDMEDWLVESDEIDVVPTDSSPSLPLPECKTNKRRTPDIREPPNKRRKVVPLIPFQKGPIWEKEIGCCDYEPFRQRGIQLLNETFFPIDPFKYVSEPASLENKKDADVFVLPALPGHLLAQSEPSAEDTRRTKRKAVISQLPPKTTFPDAHIPSLFQKIAESNTSSFVVLLDSLFQNLKSLGIKKNALEVKLREVAEKDKTKKNWTLKEDAWTKSGLVKPT